MTLFTMLHRRFVMRLNPRIIRTAWLGAVLAVVANSAFAADCDLRLSNTEVNYGDLNRAEMDIGQGRALIALGSRQLTLTAVCRQATTMGLRFDGQAAELESYRFAGKGRFTVKLKNATLDGVAVQLAQTTSATGGTTLASSAVALSQNQSVTAIAQGQRAVGKVFSVQVEIETYIDETMTRTRDVTVLEGRGSFALDTQ